MRSRAKMLAVVVSGVALVVGVGWALAQPPAEGQERGDRRTDRRRRWDPQQMRQRMLDRIKEFLEASDEEWPALQPLVEKLMAASRDTRGGPGMRMLFGRRGRPDRRSRQAPPGGPGGPDGARPAGPGGPERSAVAKAAEELSTTLDNKEAKPEAIKAKLAALRAAREKAKQDLIAAQNALREVLTQRQEAKLVLAGMLD